MVTVQSEVRRTAATPGKWSGYDLANRLAVVASMHLLLGLACCSSKSAPDSAPRTDTGLEDHLTSVPDVRDWEAQSVPKDLRLPDVRLVQSDGSLLDVPTRRSGEVGSDMVLDSAGANIDSADLGCGCCELSVCVGPCSVSINYGAAGATEVELMFAYDGQFRPTLLTATDGEGGLLWTEQYFYNQSSDMERLEWDQGGDGLLERIDEYIYEGGLLHSVLVDFGADGVPEESRTYFYQAGLLSTMELRSLPDDELQGWVVFEYTGSGLLSEETSLGAEGDVLMVQVFDYSGGLLDTTTAYINGSSVPSYFLDHVYDDFGNLCRVEQRSGFDDAWILGEETSWQSDYSCWVCESAE